MVFDVRETIWPTARLSWPVIFSPTIALVLRLNPLTNVSLSKTGVDVFFDSRIAMTLATSGVLSDISSSSTLNPYLPSPIRLLFSVEIPVLLVTSSCWLLEYTLVLLVIPIFLRVTLTVALPLVFDKPLKTTSLPLFVMVTWSDVSFSTLPSG